ncbi:MAG: D-tyrosyl-tRNA(Tyr) deacylase [Planctomycetes bacterium]|nr:D-tyrosyl-tRNA(Tyr) deacylase [Planctomycetota bacterium]
MRVVVQRVSAATVVVAGETVGAIEEGLLLLVGIGREDGDEALAWMAEKVTGLRIFRDDEGLMNRSVVEVGGGILAVSQFTLYGDCRKGKRPSFIEAARPEQAEPLFVRFVDLLRQRLPRVATGRFGAMMEVTLTNDGPVTLLLER